MELYITDNRDTENQIDVRFWVQVGSQVRLTGRSRLRALQLELHPDKQPEERRSVVQPLFLLVQKEWESQPEENESHESETFGVPQSFKRDTAPKGERQERWPGWEWARRQATAFSEDTARPTQSAPRSKRSSQQSKQQSWQSTNNDFGKAAGPANDFSTFTAHETSAEADTDDDVDNGHQLEMGTHWTPESEDDEDAGIVPLLTRSWIFENVMHAFTNIQIARRSRGLDAEKPGHPWKTKMDRLEAEAWRLYAKQQCESGFHKFAVAEHLHKAIGLHPGRGELYLDRARSRLRFACPDGSDLLQMQKALSSEMQLQILEDCEKALARDSTLLEAFDLSIQLRCIKFEFLEVQSLATRGRRSALVGDSQVQASHFNSWRRCAKAVSRGLEKAQCALKVARPVIYFAVPFRLKDVEGSN